MQPYAAAGAVAATSLGFLCFFPVLPMPFTFLGITVQTLVEPVDAERPDLRTDTPHISPRAPFSPLSVRCITWEAAGTERLATRCTKRPEALLALGESGSGSKCTDIPL